MKMHCWKLVPVFLGLLFVATDRAPAALVFNLDPTNKEFFFSGIDEGTPVVSGIDARVTWIVSDTSFSSPFTLAIDGGIAPSLGSSDVSNDFFRVVGSSLEVELRPSTAAFQSFSGTSSRFVYGTLTSQLQSELEAFVTDGGQFDLELGGGTGFSPISTNVVPEPNAVLLVTAALGIGMLLIRRRVRMRRR